MRIRKTGDWKKVGRVIGNLANEMRKARRLSLMQWGLKAESLALGHMSRQDLGWKPLKPATIAQKIRKGYSENILIATSDYFQAITSYVRDDTSYAGVKKTAIGREGEVIADIARVHEYGSESGGIPERPLWRPVFQETMEWFVTSDSRPDVIFLLNMRKYGV